MRPYMIGLLAAASGAVAAPQGMRDRSWLGVKRVAVVVESIADEPGADAAGLAGTLCARVAALAGEGSPYPVDCRPADAGPAADLDTAVIAVAAMVNRLPSASPTLAFTLRRTMQAGLEPAPIASGSSPRTLPLDRAATGHVATDEAIAAALAEVLPWRRDMDRIKRGPSPATMRGK